MWPDLFQAGIQVLGVAINFLGRQSFTGAAVFASSVFDRKLCFSDHFCAMYLGDKSTV